MPTALTPRDFLDPFVTTDPKATVAQTIALLPEVIRKRTEWLGILVKSEPCVAWVYTTRTVGNEELGWFKHRISLHCFFHSKFDCKELLGTTIANGARSCDAIPLHRHEWPVVLQVQEGILLQSRGEGTLDSPPAILHEEQLQPGDISALLKPTDYHQMGLASELAYSLHIAGGKFGLGSSGYHPPFIQLRRLGSPIAT